MRTPAIERVLALGHELVALIDSCDTRDCAGLVVEYLVSDVRGDPKPCHARDARSAQIVKPPIFYFADRINVPFKPIEALEGSRRRRENIGSNPLLLPQDIHGLERKMDDVPPAILGSRCRQVPDATFQIDLIPGHLVYLFAPLSRKHQELN
jgi:hypothetical protein